MKKALKGVIHYISCRLLKYTVGVKKRSPVQSVLRAPVTFQFSRSRFPMLSAQESDVHVSYMYLDINISIKHTVCAQKNSRCRLMKRNGTGHSRSVLHPFEVRAYFPSILNPF